MLTLPKISDLKTLFHLQSDGQHKEHQVLLLEIGTDHCYCANYDPATRGLTAIKYFAIDPQNWLDELLGVLNGFRNRSYSRAVVCSSLTSALLTPSRFAQQAHALLELVHEAPGQHTVAETIEEWQMLTVHALPQAAVDLLKERFPKLQFIHAYTVQLKANTASGFANAIHVHFTTRQFGVLVRKEGQIQLAQLYTYRTGMDVVYYLIKICTEFGFAQEEVHILLSGLIEEDSALYKDLYTYFLHLHFQGEGGEGLPSTDHPVHYFRSTLNLAACV